MLMLFVYLVSMNLLKIITAENIVRIEIKGKDQLQQCEVLSQVTLVEGNFFTLEVRSIYFIKKSHWSEHHDHDLQELKNSELSITFGRSISSKHTKTNKFMYTYSHTRKVDVHLKGTWNFTFELLRHYDPWMFDKANQMKNQEVQHCRCNTSVLINSSSEEPYTTPSSGIESPRHDTSSSGGMMIWLIVFVCLVGILFLGQTIFIIYGKTRSSKSKGNNDEDPISTEAPKTKRGSEPTRNIADRPPLPLPPDQIVQEGTPTIIPQATISRKRLPLPRSSPSPLPEKAPALHPAHKKEDAPRLHPKKLPIFPPLASCQIPDPRMSDVVWQYETLQPACKYLDNFCNTPYDNL